MRRTFFIPLFALLVVAGCDGGSTEPKGEVVIEDLFVGTGASVEAGDAVMVAYVGKLEGGSVFDLSDAFEPFAFTVGVGQVIEGWDLGIVGMKPGGTRKLTIPPGLAYGRDGRCIGDGDCPIPPNATLIFEITVVRILDTVWAQDEVVGSGTEASDGNLLLFAYVGTLSSGTLFASSTVLNPSQMILGDNVYIPGLEMGMVGMKAGGARRIIIPPHLAYGEEGYFSIPPHAVLKFSVQLLEVIQ